MTLFNKKIFFCTALLITLSLQAVAADLTQIKATGKGAKSDFSHQDLSGVDLSDIYMDGSKFINANLTSVTLNDCGECDFTDAIMTKANLKNASIDEAEMNGTQLIEANLTKAYIHNGRFRNAIITKSVMDKANVAKGRFNGAIITDTSMVGAKLSSTNFTSVTFKNVDLTYAELNYSDFTGATLEGAKFKNATLNNANFSKANVKGADFRGTDIREAIFTTRYAFDINKQRYDDIASSTTCDHLTQLGAIIDNDTKCLNK